ncbi:MAG: helix-turn-helix transcriptional regulator [Candidatus Micrarchaeia archaeon]
MTMELSGKHLANFAILLIAVGVILLLISAISGITMLVAFYKNIIVIHSINDVRTNVVRVMFNFVLPFIGGILLVLAGATINSLADTHAKRSTVMEMRRKKKQIIEHIADSMLTAAERQVLEMVRSAQNGILQSDIVIKTGYSKVKVHRILKSLEIKGLVRRGRFGITNKVFINA